MKAVSNTAEFGTYSAGPRLIDEAVRRRMRQILAEVRDASFAGRMRDDHAAGFPWFRAARRRLEEHAIEEAGRIVRAWATGPGGASP
jgi:ketol-acid reductoisomerase